MPKLSGTLKDRLRLDFVRSREGAYELYLAASLAPQSSALVRELSDLTRRSQRWAGNRASASSLRLAGSPELVVRRGRRGGLMARVLSSIYVGRVPRVVVELVLAAEARLRGIPVAQPMGAVVEWIAPCVYRSFYLTRKEEGQTLWEFARTPTPAPERARIFDCAGGAIETMYRCGLCHADLNLHNLFVTRGDGKSRVIILDLDKARLYEHPLEPSRRARNQARLLRSVRKLDPHGKVLGPEDLSRLGLRSA
jgi:hypothetical protein